MTIFITIWPFDLWGNECLANTIEYICIKFGFDSSSRFPFGVQTNKQTDATERPTHAGCYACIDKNYKKGKGFPYSLPNVGSGADPGVQTVSPQVIHPTVGCHYFPPGLRLPSQLQSMTAPWPVPSYTAWWQRHIGVNNLSKVVMQLCAKQELNPRPVDHKSNALPVVPPQKSKTKYSKI